MNFWLSALAIALVLLVNNASALSVSAPEKVTVFSTPSSFPVIIENNSSQEHAIRISFSSPTEFEIKNSSGTIPANSSRRIEIILQPKPLLEESTYSSTLNVSLGEEKTAKKIGIAFASPAQKPTGLFALAETVAAENQLDIILIIIAGVLLIAFIARFTKRIAQK